MALETPRDSGLEIIRKSAKRCPPGADTEFELSTAPSADPVGGNALLQLTFHDLTGADINDLMINDTGELIVNEFGELLMKQRWLRMMRVHSNGVL